jgi:hypothetical protein
MSQRIGRPREQVPHAVAEELLDWLCAGKSLSSFCGQSGRPSRRTVHDWRDKDPEFRRSFEIAREMGWDHLAGEAIQIADEQPPEGKATARWLAGQRLRVKTRFWLMSRWFPHR